MKKKLFINFIVLAILAVFALPVFATNYDYYAAVYKKDAAITGADTNVTTLGGRTMLFPGHIVTTSGTDDDLYYTGSAGSDTAAGYIHYFFTRLR